MTHNSLRCRVLRAGSAVMRYRCGWIMSGCFLGEWKDEPERGRSAIHCGLVVGLHAIHPAWGCSFGLSFSAVVAMPGATTACGQPGGS